MICCSHVATAHAHTITMSMMSQTMGTLILIVSPYIVIEYRNVTMMSCKDKFIWSGQSVELKVPFNHKSNYEDIYYVSYLFLGVPY